MIGEDDDCGYPPLPGSGEPDGGDSGNEAPAPTRPGLTRPAKRRRAADEVEGRRDTGSTRDDAPTRPVTRGVEGAFRGATLSATGAHTNPGTTIADRIGMPTLRTPIALLSLPGERPFDTKLARHAGRHLLGDVLGEGGMGRAIAARDIDMGRNVALKTLREEHAHDEAFIRALVFEARLTGQLEHPNIVPVYDMGVLPDGSPYYTMKLVGDLSLKDVIHKLRAGNPLAVRTYTVSRLLQYFRGMCMAMEYAHARGVIHRDLKPDNVLIGDYGEVHIMDWGVARVLPHDGRPSYFAGRVEEPGVIIGTPHYMSPEQARGETHLIDARSDVYSLGVILYQLLSYTLPFDATTTVEQLDALLTLPIPAPGDRAPEREIPPELERICLRALAFRRDARYPSARALWDDIEAFLEGKKEQERLAALAETQVEVANAAAQRYREVSAELLVLEDAVQQDDLATSFLAPLARRKEVQDRRLRAEHRHLIEARTFAEAVTGCQQALAYQPGHIAARQALAELYRSRAALMLHRNDAAAYVLYRDLERATLGPSASGAHGTLHVRAYPEGARIRIFDLEGRAELSELDGLDLGTAPVADVLLAPGSYLVSATLSSHQEARAPVVVSPGETEHVLLVLTAWDLTVPMVARAEELAAIKHAYAACVAQSQLASLMVCGRPGLGKGKLLTEFSAHLDDLPQLVAYGVVRCDPTYRYVPLQAVTEFVAHRAGIARSDTPDLIYSRLEDAVRRAYGHDGQRPVDAVESAEIACVARRIASLPTLCGRAFASTEDQALDGAAYARLVFDAVASFLRNLGERVSIVLAIRGADHLDRLSRDMLFYLAERLADTPLFCLMFTEHDALELRCDQTITLSRLDTEQVQRQIALLLRGRVSDDLLALVATRSDGNAFQVAELTRLLMRRELLEHDGREWTLSARADGLAELDLESLLVDTLATLEPTAREVLERACVAGGRFWVEPVELALGRAIDTELEDLVASEILVPRPATRFAGTREFSFRHDDLQRLLYDRIGPARRADGHRDLAVWLSRFADRHLRDLALVAAHYYQAGDSVAAAPLMARIAAVAAEWEGADAPGWYDWPEDLRSGVFPQISGR